MPHFGVGHFRGSIIAILWRRNNQTQGKVMQSKQKQKEGTCYYLVVDYYITAWGMNSRGPKIFEAFRGTILYTFLRLCFTRFFFWSCVLTLAPFLLSSLHGFHLRNSCEYTFLCCISWCYIWFQGLLCIRGTIMSQFIFCSMSWLEIISSFQPLISICIYNKNEAF